MFLTGNPTREMITRKLNVTGITRLWVQLYCDRRTNECRQLSNAIFTFIPMLKYYDDQGMQRESISLHVPVSYNPSLFPMA